MPNIDGNVFKGPRPSDTRRHTSFHPSQNVPDPVPITNEDKIRENIKLCETKLQQYKEITIFETKKLFLALDEIKNTETSCYGSVGKMLGRYASLQRWKALYKKSEFILESILRHETNVIKMREEFSIKELEDQIRNIDTQIEKAHSEGDNLINYACTTYAEMVVTIEEMKNYHKLLEFAFDWETSLLMRQRKDFEVKISRRLEVAESKITMSVRKEMYNLMDCKTLQMEKNNNVLREILKDYEEELVKREKAVKTLSEDIKVMLNDPAIDQRKVLFPEIFNQRADCTPDMEFKLDIPIKTYIPI